MNIGKPYVGVTGFTSRPEVYALFEAMGYGWPRERQLMFGVLVSWKTLHGLPASNPRQFLEVDQASTLMPAHPDVFNVVHYNSRDPWLLPQLNRIAQLLPNYDGIQLNMIWPDPEALSKFRSDNGRRIIIQVSRDAYMFAGGTPEALIERLKHYEGVADYVLVDPSGGLGVLFDDGDIRARLEALVGSGLGFKWGVAGGLAPNNLVEKLSGLLEIDPNLSWDAQAGLRSDYDALESVRLLAFVEYSRQLLSRAAV